MSHPAEGNRLSKAEMACVRACIAAVRANKSQTATAQEFGVSQSLIARIEDTEAPHTISIGTAQRMAAAAGVAYSVFTRGTESAGRWETLDHIKLRGRALDVLSTVYDEEFLDALRTVPPPPESESWTLEQWHDFLTDVRKAWKSGIFKIPGVVPPKRE